VLQSWGGGEKDRKHQESEGRPRSTGANLKRVQSRTFTKRVRKRGRERRSQTKTSQLYKDKPGSRSSSLKQFSDPRKGFRKQRGRKPAGELKEREHRRKNADDPNPSGVLVGANVVEKRNTEKRSAKERTSRRSRTPSVSAERKQRREAARIVAL